MIKRRTLIGVLASLPFVGTALARGAESGNLSGHKSPFANDPTLIPIPEDHVLVDGGYGRGWCPYVAPLGNMEEIEFVSRYFSVQSDWDLGANGKPVRCYWAWKIRRGEFIRIFYSPFGRSGVFADPSDNTIHRHSDIVLWRFASEPYQFGSLKLERDKTTGLPVGYELAGNDSMINERRAIPRGRYADTREELGYVRHEIKERDEAMRVRYEKMRLENNKRRAEVE